MARPIPHKVCRLVPMLGSSADNEALATVRAIGRVLDGAGLGFVDLAAAIPAQPAEREVLRHHPRPAHRGPASGVPEFRVYAWRRAYTPKQEAEHRARVRYCLDRPYRLTVWEQRFIASVDPLRGNLTVRQGDALACIVDRLEWEARCA